MGQFKGAKGAKIQPEAPICSSSQLSTMAVLSAQKVSGKKFENFENSAFEFFMRKKIEKKSSKIQGETHLNQLWK